LTREHLARCRNRRWPQYLRLLGSQVVISRQYLGTPVGVVINAPLYNDSTR
jgi:hypothetical protein